jgi:hypothetical protein
VLTSLQVLLRLATLRWLGVFICALAPLLAAANTASALEPAQTKTRIWGFDFAKHNSGGLFRAASSGKHQGNRLAEAAEASGSLLAARGLANVSPTVAELRALGSVKGFQVHHILPEYLGKMLGYTSQQMTAHPGTFISQWAHTGALNPAAMHKAISRYLPPMVNGQRATYSAAQIRGGLQQAYADLGRSDLFGAIEHLIL